MKKQRYSQAPSSKRFIVQNTENGSFEEYYDNQNYLLTDRFYKKIKSETDWYEHIIEHNPSIGDFYENLLRNTLKEFSPSNNKIGTGFIFDLERGKHGKQIDILVYDDSDRSVLYRNGDFVVIYPGSVLSATEVKKTLNSNNLRDVVKTTFFNSMGSYTHEVYGVQRFNIFTYKLGCKIETIVKSLVAEIENCIDELHLEEGCMLPVCTISLPFVYFLDENYSIETRLLHKKGMEYEIEVELHKTYGHGSLGNFLSNCLKENINKVTRFEDSLLSTKVRAIPEVNKIKKILLLNRKVSFSKIIEYYVMTKSDLNKIKINDEKPLSIYIPITKNLDDYKSYQELFSSDGIMVEMFNPNTSEINPVDANIFKLT